MTALFDFKNRFLHHTWAKKLLLTVMICLSGVAYSEDPPCTIVGGEKIVGQVGTSFSKNFGLPAHCGTFTYAMENTMPYQRFNRLPMSSPITHFTGGLSLDPNTGVLSGVPTTAGMWFLVVKAINFSENIQIKNDINNPFAVIINPADGANTAPTLSSMSNLGPTPEYTPLTINYTDLIAAGDEADLEASSVMFRIESVNSGILTKGGSAVTPGTTTIATGESLVWMPAADESGTINAFSVTAYDGTLASLLPVVVNVEVTAVNDPPMLSGYVISNVQANGSSVITYASMLAGTGAYDAERSEISFRVEAVISGTLRKGGEDVISGVTTLAANEELAWYPPANVIGTVNAFTVSARDSSNAYSSPVQIQADIQNYAISVTMNTSNKVYPLEGPNMPIIQGSTYPLQGSISSQQELSSITCTYESVGLSSLDPNYAAPGSNCTSLGSLVLTNSVLMPGKVTFSSNISNKNFTMTWRPKSTQRGTFKFTVTGYSSTPEASGSSHTYVTVRENFVASNAATLIDALSSSDNLHPFTSIPMMPRLDGSENDNSENWLNLATGGSSMSLVSTDSSPWVGTGAHTSPYSLNCNNTNCSVLASSVNLNPAATSFGMWVKQEETGTLWSNGINLHGVGALLVDTDNTLLGGLILDSWGWVESRSPAVFKRSDATRSYWNYITLTYGAAVGQEIYYNGQKVANNYAYQGLASNPDGRVRFLVNPDDGSAVLKGGLAFGHLHTARLTAAEVRQNFNATANRFRATPVEDIVSDSLVLHLDPANSDKGVYTPDPASNPNTTEWFNLGSASTPKATLANFDSSSSSNSGWANGVLYMDGNDGQFAGTNDLVTVAHSPDLSFNNSQSFSINIWYNEASTVTGYGCIMQKGADSATYNYRICTFPGSPATIKVDINVPGGGNSVASCNLGTRFGVPHHFVAVKNAGDRTLKAYLDGALCHSVYDNLNATSTLPLILGRFANADHPFNGWLGPIMIYNRALSPEEVKQNCHAQKGRYSDSSCVSP